MENLQEIRARTIAMMLVSLSITLAALGQDVFSSGGQPQSGGDIITSVTNFYNGNCDVKLYNPRTHYTHSLTIPCLSPTLPKLRASPDSKPQFKKAIQDCFGTIKRLAAADSGSPINRLLNSLTNIPITVHPRPASDSSNVTQYSGAGKPVDINWSPTEKYRYEDGANKNPCATLLHELTHAWENYNGLDNGELEAVRAENWLLWKLGGTQRTKYGTTNLPVNSVVWPQAAH